MNEVYVLSGREDLGNSDWGYGCTEISVFGVYSDFEKAKEAFKNKVLEIAESLVESESEFEYTEDEIFDCIDADEDVYGWDCYLSENSCTWELYHPENDDFEYGTWFLPTVTLQKYEIK